MRITGTEMPSNVARFERLMYLSLGIGVLVSALTWTRLVAQAGRVGGATFVFWVQAITLAIIVCFIWLVARRRKNWARWLLLIIGVLGLPGYFRMLAPTLHFAPIAGILSLTQLVLQVIATVMIFTGNARDWFAAPART